MKLALPASPRVPGALREAASDLYYNSWRLVPANALWGGLLVAIFVAAAAWPVLAALVALLALPVAGLHHMAALIARGEAVAFSDFFAGMRRHAAPALALGLAATALAFVLTTNVFIGLEAGDIPGWLLSAFALYGNVFLAMFLVAAWPILTDPLRHQLPVRRRLWLAAAVTLARPGRMFVLTLVITLLLLLASILFAVLLTVAVAYTSLVATRYVLPAADRLEGRTTVALGE